MKRSYFDVLKVHCSIFIAGYIPGSILYEMLCSRAYRCNWNLVIYIMDLWFYILFGEIDHCRMCFEWQRSEGIYKTYDI